MIHVGSDDKIVFVFQQFEKVIIDRSRCRDIAVEINVATPVGPKFLLGGEVVETSRADKASY
jgi:hypothetical protein